MRVSVAKLMQQLLDEGLVPPSIQVDYHNGAGWTVKEPDASLPLIFATYPEVLGYLRGREQRRIYFSIVARKHKSA